MGYITQNISPLTVVEESSRRVLCELIVDCSHEGFEGIRAQDILPLLIQDFYFETFVAFGNIVNVFVDRSFGPNFDLSAAADKDFIDEVSRIDEEMLEKGVVKPTQMIAALRSIPVPTSNVYKHWTPEFCVRTP